MSTQKYAEIWQEICFILSVNIKVTINEKEFEHQVLRAMEVLGWREFKGEIERQISIQVGRQGVLRPDLVVYGEERKALIVIEVKRPQEDVLRDESRAQLKSYMRQMKTDFGLLIGRELQIYYDGNLKHQADLLLIDRIPFIKEEKTGHNFVEMFVKRNFLSGTYRPILEEKIRKFNIKRERQKLKNKLLSGDIKEKIFTFLKNEFSDYDSNMVTSVLSKTQIKIFLEDISDQLPPQKADHYPVKGVKRRIIRTSNPLNHFNSGKTYSLPELKDMCLGKEHRPMALIIRGQNFEVSNWTDLSIKFVEWLIRSQLLNKSKLPIYTYSENDKYFINSSPEHKFSEKNGQWNQIFDGIYVDTKYNAEGHKKNVEYTLKHLGIYDAEIRISFK